MILTQHNDNARTGANTSEMILTPSRVSSRTFGRVAECLVDGSLYAQPLLVPTDSDSPFESPVLIVATMHNTLYAFNASSSGIASLAWGPVHLIDSVQLPAPDVGHPNYNDIIWELGIVSTPVIDTETDRIYCVTHSRDASSEFNNHPVNILWAVQLSTGNVFAQSSPIQPPNFGSSQFHTNRQLQRSAITLSSGLVYVAYSSFGDTTPYTGWIVSFDSTDLTMQKSWATTTDEGQASIWQSGQGPAVDADGSLYFMTGNGDFDTNKGEYGDSVVKLSADLATNPLSYFTPFNQSWLNNGNPIPGFGQGPGDMDLGSSGILLIQNPDTGGPMCLGGGKESILYLMDCNNLGGHQSSKDNVIQTVGIAAGDNNHQILGPPVLYDSPGGMQYAFIWAQADNLKRFRLANRHLSTLVQNLTITQPDNVPGGTAGQGGFLSLSCDGETDESAILWANHAYSGGVASGDASDPSEERVPGILYAFDALSSGLAELWNSLQNPLDDYGNYNKFACPTVGNGRAYQGTMGGIQQNLVLNDQCTGSPAMINMNDSQLVIAFASTTSPQVLCVRWSNDGVTWPDANRHTIPSQTTLKSPGLAYDSVNDSAYIAWIATDGTERICLMECDNDPTLDNWYGPGRPSSETSGHGVALAFGAGNLFVGWTDVGGSLNVGITSDLMNMDVKYTLNETSSTKPYLLFQPDATGSGGTLYIAWLGTNGWLNVNSCTDFSTLKFSPSTKVEITRETSTAPPALNFDIYGQLWISWTGSENNQINQIVSDQTSPPEVGLAAWPNYKRTFTDTSPAGVALCTYQGRTHVAWEASDGVQSLCTAILNRGSVAVYGLLEN